MNSWFAAEAACDGVEAAGAADKGATVLDFTVARYYDGS
jgi:hypothetical protein